MDDLVKKQDVVDAIHKYFFEQMEATETIETEDGGAYDLKLVEPLLEHNKALSKRIEGIAPVQPELATNLQPTCNNVATELISRQAAIDAVNTALFPKINTAKDAEKALNELPSVQPERWIPIKTRPMTDEERDYWSNQYGYDVEYEQSVMFDCKMPKDKQAIWVQTKCGIVFEDVCEDDDGMIGLEGNGDWDDIVAWMPKYIPEPYKGES